MTYEDIPSNLRELSLDDRNLATDVVDLCCYEEARANGSLTVLLCDSAGRMLQPIAIDDMPDDVPLWELSALMEQLFAAVTELGKAVVVAFCRPGGAVTDVDRQRHERVITACERAGMRLIGTYVAAPGQVIRLPDPAVAA